MKFKKKINNNVAWAITDDGKEVVVTGKGISFNKVEGQKLLEQEIEKQYHYEDDKFQLVDEVISGIPEQILSLTELILTKAKDELAINQIGMSSYVSLADHLNYALKRSSEDVFDYPENLKWEVKRLYPKESAFATDILFLIEKETDVRLPKSEVTFLTYHFVNLQYGMDVKRKSYELSDLLNRALEIIEYHYQLSLDQNSVNYIRFVTHVRHFILRQMNKEYNNQNIVDDNLLSIAKINYKKAYQAAEKIINMVELKQTCKISEDEKFYLTLHIERVTNRK